MRRCHHMERNFFFLCDLCASRMIVLNEILIALEMMLVVEAGRLPACVCVFVQPPTVQASKVSLSSTRQSSDKTSYNKASQSS